MNIEKVKSIIKNRWPIFVLLVLSLPIIQPYFHQGFFSTHDGEWAVVRLADMFRTLRDGQFPARYSGYLNHGFGYPLFNFTYPFPYYLGVALHFFHLGFVDSVKTIFAGSVVFSGLGMYFVSKQFWKNKWAGFFSAILYVFLPYRIVDLYVRGSIGESVAIAIFPWLVLSAIRLTNKFNAINFLLVSILTAALIVSHNIMAIYFGFTLGVFFLSQTIIIRKMKTLSTLLAAFLLGLGLSTFFWLPALVEKKYTSLSLTPIADRSLYFLKPLDLILPKWGYGVPDSTTGFGYQLGWPQAIIFLLVLLTIVLKLIQGKKVNVLVFSFALLTIIFLCLLFTPSVSIWQSVPFLSDINYPWTLLAPIGFLVAFLSGSLWQYSKWKFVLPIFALASIFLVLPHAQPRSFVNFTDDHYLTNDATTTSSDELMPIWVKIKPTQQPKTKVEIVSGNGEISDIVSNSRYISFQVNLQTESTVQVNTIYYPGWQAKVGNKQSPIEYQNFQGVMQLHLLKGPSLVSFEFQETTVRHIANIISLTSTVVLIGNLVYLAFARVRSKSAAV